MSRFKAGRTFCLPWAVSFNRSGRFRPRKQTQYGLAFTKSTLSGVIHTLSIRIRGNRIVIVDAIPMKRKRGLLDTSAEPVFRFTPLIRYREAVIVRQGTAASLNEARRSASSTRCAQCLNAN